MNGGGERNRKNKGMRWGRMNGSESKLKLKKKKKTIIRIKIVYQ